MKERLQDLRRRFDHLQQGFKIDALKQEMQQVEAQMARVDFWNNAERAQETVKRLKQIKETLAPFAELERTLEDAQVMSLHERAVVVITAGLRFIGQRLDPREFLPEMMTPSVISPLDPGLLEGRRHDALKGVDVDEEGVRGGTDQIGKDMESEEGDESNE